MIGAENIIGLSPEDDQRINRYRDAVDEGRSQQLFAAHTRECQSAHPELQPDIEIHVGKPAGRCENDGCGQRAIYLFRGQLLCRACATRVQSVLNRLRRGIL